MNISTSECSSGCESGWTMYFDQISSSSMPVDQYDYNSKGKFVNRDRDEEEEEDEDLSMLSDASSGPPHFLQQEEENSEINRYNSVISGAESKKGKHKKKEKEHRRTQSVVNFQLDDTASSPVYNYTKKNAVLENDKSVVYNHQSAFSATHQKGKSVLKKHFGFFKP